VTSCFGGLCFLTFYGRLAGRTEVLFMVLFPGFLLWCSFVASIDVVLLSDFVGNELKFPLEA
jgi:hypothetical protein